MSTLSLGLVHVDAKKCIFITPAARLPPANGLITSVRVTNQSTLYHLSPPSASITPCHPPTHPPAAEKVHLKARKKTEEKHASMLQAGKPIHKRQKSRLKLRKGAVVRGVKIVDAETKQQVKDMLAEETVLNSMEMDL